MVEMPPEGPEAQARLRLVLKQDEAAIVLWIWVDRGCNDRCGQGREHLGSRRRKNIEPKMHVATLAFCQHRLEEGCRIDDAPLPPGSETESEPVLAHELGIGAVGTVIVLGSACSSQGLVKAAEVQNMFCLTRRVRSHERCKIPAIGGKPLPDAAGSRGGFEPARLPQNASRNAMVDDGEFSQKIPSGLFTHEEIGILGCA